MVAFLFPTTRRVVEHIFAGLLFHDGIELYLDGFRSRKVQSSIISFSPPQVEAGVVRVLSELSTSYKEKTQLYCARALCNLACHHGSEKSLVEGGGVAALMMIALVRQGSTRNRATYFPYASRPIFRRNPSDLEGT